MERERMCVECKTKMPFYVFLFTSCPSGMWIVVSWVVIPCSLVGSYQYFRGTYCLQLQCGNIGNCLQDFMEL
jgi:hypothetical protein